MVNISECLRPSSHVLLERDSKSDILFSVAFEWRSRARVHPPLFTVPSSDGTMLHHLSGHAHEKKEAPQPVTGCGNFQHPAAGQGAAALQPVLRGAAAARGVPHVARA